jgi:hypothetical protein
MMTQLESFTGRCHCGAVTLTIPAKPAYINDCNCTLCSKLGVLWGYFDPTLVSIVGVTSAYRRVDRKIPSISAHFCAVCGCTTHWAPLATRPANRMGVNMRLFATTASEGVEVKHPDGLAWQPEE